MSSSSTPAEGSGGASIAVAMIWDPPLVCSTRVLAIFIGNHPSSSGFLDTTIGGSPRRDDDLAASEQARVNRESSGAEQDYRNGNNDDGEGHPFFLEKDADADDCGGKG